MEKAVAMKGADNVATCLADMAKGSAIAVARDGDRIEVTLRDDIPFGHKIALADIPAGTEVLKYAEVIGLATQNIAAGDHVHVHIVESRRARGDKT